MIQKWDCGYFVFFKIEPTVTEIVQMIYILSDCLILYRSAFITLSHYRLGWVSAKRWLLVIMEWCQALSSIHLHNRQIISSQSITVLSLRLAFSNGCVKLVQGESGGFRVWWKFLPPLLPPCRWRLTYNIQGTLEWRLNVTGTLIWAANLPWTVQECVRRA